MKNFKVGDKVRIRKWDDMAKEFGLTLTGSIRTGEGKYFLPEMRYNCGKVAVIKAISETGAIKVTVNGFPIIWNFYECMLEPVYKPVSKRKLKVNLKAGRSDAKLLDKFIAYNKIA